jgi:hypothetical protein
MLSLLSAVLAHAGIYLPVKIDRQIDDVVGRMDQFGGEQYQREPLFDDMVPFASRTGHISPREE